MTQIFAGCRNGLTGPELLDLIPIGNHAAIAVLKSHGNGPDHTKVRVVHGAKQNLMRPEPGRLKLDPQKKMPRRLERQNLKALVWTGKNLRARLRSKC